MLPPGKQISFLCTETWNDGLLEQAFSKHLGVTFEDAKHQLAVFAQKVNSMLELGKRIEFPEFGTLRMTADRELRFSVENTQQFTPDSFGLLEIEMNPLYSEPSSKTADKEKTPDTVQQPSKKRRCNTVCWILIGLVLLLAGGYVFQRPLLQWIEEMSYTTEELAYLHRPQHPATANQPALPPAVQPAVPAVNETTPPAPVTTTLVEPAVKKETVAKPATEQTGRSRLTNQFHIMVAGFDNETAANQLAKKITDTEGYICLVLHTGGSNPYKVSILRYHSQQEAEVILNGIKQTDSSDYHNAWVEKY